MSDTDTFSVVEKMHWMRQRLLERGVPLDEYEYRISRDLVRTLRRDLKMWEVKDEDNDKLPYGVATRLFNLPVSVDARLHENRIALIRSDEAGWRFGPVE